MTVKIFAVKDVKSGFQSPFTRVNKDIATRDFKNLCSSVEPNIITMNPEDYELWQLGTMDIDSGVIVSDVDFIVSAIGVKND